MTPWSRHVHHEVVWGTVVTFDVRGPELDDRLVAAACREAAAELHRIDAWLSPFRTDSELTRLRTGDLVEVDASEPVREVLADCRRIRSLTDGRFDPWAAPGGLDTCAYVKGWGADRAAETLLGFGLAHVSVNAAGDVTCRGRSSAELDGWRIGIVDPRDRTQVIDAVIVQDAHLATSGSTEQGGHVVDPATGTFTTHAGSASVLHARGGTADALATALYVSGPSGLPALTALDCSALVVTEHDVWSTGPAFARTDDPVSAISTRP